MTLLNSYIHKNDFQTIFESYIDFFREFGYGDLNNDALWKWSSILYSLEILGVKESDIVVDIGGGKSPIAKILSSLCSVISIDKYPDNNWFPTNSDGEYIKSTGLLSRPERINFQNVDFFDWCKTEEDNSVNFMYDSCSVIHFKTSSITSVNDGCTEVAKEVSRILKPGGYFIVASDILHPNHENPAHPNYSVGEFLFFKQLANVFITRTLHSYGGFDFNFDDDFNTNILQVNKSLPNYNRLNHTFYQGKQDWKTFCHYEEYCHSNLAIGRLVFRKDTL